MTILKFSALHLLMYDNAFFFWGKKVVSDTTDLILDRKTTINTCF